MERTQSGTEVKMIVTENHQAKDPKQRFGFVRFIDDFVGSGYFDEWDLEVMKRVPLWIEIFCIENLGHMKLQLDEEWLLKVDHIHEAPVTKITRDGRKMAFVYVELVNKIEKLVEERFDRAKKVFRRTFQSGKRVRVEETPATWRENVEYRLPDGRIIKINEIIVGGELMYEYPRISGENEYSHDFSERYRGTLKPETISRIVRSKIANIPPAPEPLVRAIAEKKILPL